MAKKNNDSLFYVCSLIEYMGRMKKLPCRDIVEKLGKETIDHIYEYADVFHCDLIEKVATEFCEQCQIEDGTFDNVAECQYTAPGYWDIGEVYERLIEDCYEYDELIDGIWEVYHSWIDRTISDYNTDFYYQSREYIAECYKAGKILE